MDVSWKINFLRHSDRHERRSSKPREFNILRIQHCNLLVNNKVPSNSKQQNFLTFPLFSIFVLYFFNENNSLRWILQKQYPRKMFQGLGFKSTFKPKFSGLGCWGLWISKLLIKSDEGVCLQSSHDGMPPMYEARRRLAKFVKYSHGNIHF